MYPFHTLEQSILMPEPKWSALDESRTHESHLPRLEIANETFETLRTLEPHLRSVLGHINCVSMALDGANQVR